MGRETENEPPQPKSVSVLRSPEPSKAGALGSAS